MNKTIYLRIYIIKMKSLFLKKTHIQIVSVSSCRSNFYLKNKSDCIFLNQNYLTSVSSIEPSTLVKVMNEIGNNSHGVITFVSNDDDVKTKIFTINNAKLVKKNGKQMVKIEVSTENLKAVGNYAKEAIKIKNNLFKDASLTVTSFDWGFPYIPGIDYFDGANPSRLVQAQMWKLGFLTSSVLVLRRLRGVNESTTKWWFFGSALNENFGLVKAVRHEDKLWFYGEDIVGEGTRVLVIAFKNNFLVNFKESFGVNYQDWLSSSAYGNFPRMTDFQ